MDETTCRICLKECDHAISIFTKQEEYSPYEKLHKLKLIEITDSGSNSICSRCLSELNTCVKFFEKCEKTNNFLTSSFEHHNNCLEHNSAHLDYKNLQHAKHDTSINEIEIIHQEPLVQNSCTLCGSKLTCQHKPTTIYSCQFCNKVFTKKFNRDIHVKRHLGLREWPCVACGAPQVSTWHAKRHCAVGERYACPAPDCTRSYTSAHNLTVHIRNHTGERPYECDDCGKRFTSKTTLTDHIRTHTGIKPYMCSICGARFTTNKLIVHMKSHDPKPKPKTRPVDTNIMRTPKAGSYECSYCLMRYSHKQSLNRHLRKRHLHSSDY